MQTYSMLKCCHTSIIMNKMCCYYKMFLFGDLEQEYFSKYINSAANIENFEITKI